jgi:5-methylcytosine-specific restriction enzyme B
MSGLEKDVKNLSDKNIKTLIKNYQTKRETGRPYYQTLIVEANRRDCGELNIENSIAAITEAARNGSYLSYGDVAKASGCEWKKVRHPMNQHLQRVLEYCHARNAPLLSSIVVNQQALKSGELQDKALGGFVRGVEEATGIKIADPVQFLNEEQARVFSWAGTAK